MSTDASQSQGGADAPASVNNPRSAAAAATAAANAISRTKQARARTRFFDLWAVVAAILLLAATVYLLNILSVPVAILIWTVIIVFCLRGIVNGLEKRHINRGLGTTIAYVIMALVLALIGFLLFSPMFGLNAQFNDLVSNLPHYVDAVIAWGNDLYTRYAPVLEDETVKSVISEVQKSAASFASSHRPGQRERHRGLLDDARQRPDGPRASRWSLPSGSSWSCRPWAARPAVSSGRSAPRTLSSSTPPLRA